jgi:hypothetical protein
MQAKRPNPANDRDAAKPRSKRPRERRIVGPTGRWAEAYLSALEELNRLIGDATALRDLSRLD